MRPDLSSEVSDCVSRTATAFLRSFTFRILMTLSAGSIVKPRDLRCFLPLSFKISFAFSFEEIQSVC